MMIYNDNDNDNDNDNNDNTDDDSNDTVVALIVNKWQNQ